VIRVRLKGINTVRKRLADGTIATYFYHRETGHRLRGEPGSPEFLASIAEAEKLVADRLAGRLQGAFSGLVRDYTGSAEFAELADSTRRERRRQLATAEREFGDMPVGVLNDPAVRKEFTAWGRKVASASGNRESDGRLSAISAMLSWAVENHDGVVVNHLRGFKHRYHSDRSDKIWTPENIDAFMKVAPLELQQAMILALHTGQRQGDLLRLVWTQYDGAFIRLRQSKTKRRGVAGPLVEIPVTTTLKQMLDGMPRRAATILTTRSARPFDRGWFGNLWRRTTKAAGIEDLHFHDTRGTAVTLLSEAGCTPQEVAAITGHRLKSAAAILDKYLARTRVLAEAAIIRFENSSQTEFANRLQTGTGTEQKGTKKTDV
jgi:integrase